MKKLIPMVDYIIDLSKNGYKEYELIKDKKSLLFPDRLRMWMCNKHIKYAWFLNQPIKLEMFIPCDEEGIVLEEPKIEDYSQDDLENSVMGCDVLDYKKAQEKVLFKGNWKHTEDTRYIGMNWVSSGTISVPMHSIKTIEDLIPLGLELTKPF